MEYNAHFILVHRNTHICICVRFHTKIFLAVDAEGKTTKKRIFCLHIAYLDIQMCVPLSAREHTRMSGNQERSILCLTCKMAWHEWMVYRGPACDAGIYFFVFFLRPPSTLSRCMCNLWHAQTHFLSSTNSVRRECRDTLLCEGEGGE